MVSQNRILTVSYGTFSCTLEGFDDPFGTMRAIAEYFRDLAAEDRYFGAEPPQPDAAMLHRIAERETQRRIEAKVEENSVTLRASEIVPEAVPTVSEAPAVEHIAAASQDEADLPQPRVSIPAISAEAKPAPALHGIDDSIVEKLARIRAAVARNREPQVVPVAPVAVVEVFEDDLEPEVAPAAQSLAGHETETETEIEAVSEAVDAAAYDVAPAEQSAPAGVSQDVVAQDSMAQEAVAAVAVVEAADEPVAAPQVYMAPEAVAPDLGSAAVVALDVEQGEDDTLAQRLEEEELALRLKERAERRALRIERRRQRVEAAALAAAAAPEEVEAPAAVAADLPIDFSSLEASFESLEDVLSAAPALPQAEAEEAAPEEILAEEDRPEAASLTTAEPAAEIGDVDDLIARLERRAQTQVSRLPVEPVSEAEDNVAAPEAEGAPAVETPAAALRVMVRRLTLGEAAPAADVAEAPAFTPVRPSRPTASRSASARPARPVVVAPLHPQGLQAVPQEAQPLRASRLIVAAEGEQAVDRLIRAANSEMTEQDTLRRSATIAHLRAAVAATEADTVETKEVALKRAEAATAAYKGDLAALSRSPAGAAVSPLVLMPTQRITRPPVAAPLRPVAQLREPQRGAAVLAEEPEFEDTMDLEDYWDATGAREMIDRLEATAAWLMISEEASGFSRGQILQLCSGGGSDEMRDSALIGFSQLLKEGRMIKRERGIYALPATSDALKVARDTLEV